MQIAIRQKQQQGAKSLRQQHRRTVLAEHRARLDGSESWRDLVSSWLQCSSLDLLELKTNQLWVHSFGEAAEQLFQHFSEQTFDRLCYFLRRTDVCARMALQLLSLVANGLAFRSPANTSAIADCLLSVQLGGQNELSLVAVALMNLLQIDKDCLPTRRLLQLVRAGHPPDTLNNLSLLMLQLVRCVRMVEAELGQFESALECLYREEGGHRTDCLAAAIESVRQGGRGLRPVLHEASHGDAYSYKLVRYLDVVARQKSLEEYASLEQTLRVAGLLLKGKKHLSAVTAGLLTTLALAHSEEIVSEAGVIFTLLDLARSEDYNQRLQSTICLCALLLHSPPHCLDWLLRQPGLFLHLCESLGYYADTEFNLGLLAALTRCVQEEAQCFEEEDRSLSRQAAGFRKALLELEVGPSAEVGEAAQVLLGLLRCIDAKQ